MRGLEERWAPIGRRRAELKAVLLVIGLVVAPSMTAFAQLSNGGFENGDLTGWTPGGGASVEALQASNLSPSVTPTEGSWFALLSSGPGDVPGAPGGDFDFNGTPDFDSTTLTTSFTTTNPGDRLSFDWAFLTSEIGQPATYDDLFDVRIDGISILRGSVNHPGGVSPFPDTPAYDGAGYSVSSTGATNGSVFSGGISPFRSMCLAIADPGLHTLEFLIADQGDSVYDSGLLIDDVQAPSTCDTNVVQVTDTTGVNLEVKGGGFLFAQQINWKVASSQDGAVLAYVSNGDATGDNPNLKNQIFVSTGGGFERITAATGGHVANPSLTSNGRWVVFEASDDLVPGSPGNADGNIEVFRWDRNNSTMTQVTDTTGCSNRHPTISRNNQGRRVALETDCTDLIPGFNADGNSEIVIWNANTGAFVFNETTGCDNRQPTVSRHNQGRYVTFLSDCDYVGSNADANSELFQWDRVTNSYRQITDSSAAAGALNDVTASSVDGRYVAFLSNADYAGQNADGNFEVFRYDRNGAGSFVQLTDTNPLVVHTATAIEDTGRYLAVEQLDLLTSTFTVLHADATTGNLTPVVSGDPTLPVIALDGGAPLVAFQSAGDYAGANPDGNTEIWQLSHSFVVPVTRLHCSTPNLGIPDNSAAGLTDTLTITDSVTLQDLDVSLEATHSWVGDLVFTLEHLSTGTTVTLIARPGSPPGFGCSGDDLDTTLDDEASLAVENQCVTPGPVAIEGRFTPEGTLSDFDGENLSGDWQITAQDLGGGDTGTLVKWCLISVG